MSKLICPNGCSMDRNYPFMYPVNGDYVLLGPDESISNFWSDGAIGVNSETRDYLKEMLKSEFPYCARCGSGTEHGK